jgi:hypothetical protein
VAHGLEEDGVAAKATTQPPYAPGTFAAQDPSGAGPQGTLLMCKLGWWTGAPWDVRAYAAGHPAYPTDSTLEQLYDSAEFDAYRELGACSVQLALEQSHLPASVGLEKLSADSQVIR